MSLQRNHKVLLQSCASICASSTRVLQVPDFPVMLLQPTRTANDPSTSTPPTLVTRQGRRLVPFLPSGSLHRWIVSAWRNTDSIEFQDFHRPVLHLPGLDAMWSLRNPGECSASRQQHSTTSFAVFLPQLSLKSALDCISHFAHRHSSIGSRECRQSIC